MRHLILVSAILFCTATIAQEKPKEIKEESEVKIIRVKDSDKTTEKKIKVVTRETGTVELDENDKNKVNQNRIDSPVKVEKTVMVDDSEGNGYDLLQKETYYVLGDEKYLFSPNDNGFDMAFNPHNNTSVKVTKALTSSNKRYYIINGDMYSGIGYFDSNENFIIEYYNKDTNTIEMKTFKKTQ